MSFLSINPSEIVIKDNIIKILAFPQTDFFTERGCTNMYNAPFYYFYIKTNFIIKVKVSLDFETINDSAAIMIMKNTNVWAKLNLVFENSEQRSIISIVKDNKLCIQNKHTISKSIVWFKVQRLESIFTFYYSFDNKKFIMLKSFDLNTDNEIKVGLVAQSPNGLGGVGIFEDLIIDKINIESNK